MKSKNQLSELMRIEEVMKHFSISRTSVWRMEKNHNLPSVKIGSMKFFKKDDLEKLINKNYTTPLY